MGRPPVALAVTRALGDRDFKAQLLEIGAENASRCSCAGGSEQPDHVTRVGGQALADCDAQRPWPSLPAQYSSIALHVRTRM